MKRDIKVLMKELTLEEKAGLCSGLDAWRTKAVERLGIPAIMMTDGPHGLRKQKPDNMFESIPATCYPSAVGRAASWDRELMDKVGIALGEECQAEDVAILLGPGVNIKRSPLGGRNFEYFSEDPYLSSELATHHINGVQSQGVGTALKHFAANNQEHRRLTIDAIIDERTLREIYLASFEGAVKQSQPWTVMCSYNKVNGDYASENEYLLTDILKNEWGHEGFVMSDWGAVNKRVDALAAGLELEMPSSSGLGDRKIVDAVRNGELSEQQLDAAVERLLTVIFKAADNKKFGASYDTEAHHQLAREAARESMVLLKNEDDLLPLPKSSKIAVIGALAKTIRYQGGGSSHIKPTRLENAFEEMVKSAGLGAEIMYAQGYDLESDAADPQQLEEALTIARDADVIIVFAGVPERYESEGFDRKDLRLPDNQNLLIDSLASVQNRVIVVLCNGAPVEMPWVSRVKGILEAYLGGQAVGGAIADLLFGDANPCGKLAETFPERLCDNPSYLFFPGDGDRVEYREGIFVGYRYYDTKSVRPLFPFGHGLSYTTFEYSDLLLDKREIDDTETVRVSVKVKNIGTRVGKEIVQLYVRDVASSMTRPIKELKGFDKVSLEPGEEKTITFVLDKRSFAYYNVEIADWHVESGEFEILIGKSSQDIVFQQNIQVNSTTIIRKLATLNTTIEELAEFPGGLEFMNQLKQYLPFGFDQVGELDATVRHMIESFVRAMPLRQLLTMSGGRLTEEMMDGILAALNS
ncbi:glycoside hydrolase family 3 C-terminal domain-containing protein [Paenibacillus sp. LjRoot153]|uniref:beta-glucosidase n=1 Tax=Paenibacillus sp. LjRoot153 TaxID=3342270 RepID=UPI003ED08C88